MNKMVIGGNNPTVQVTVPVPTPAPMKKKPRPQQAAPQPVPTNPDSAQQPTPQGLDPAAMQQPMVPQKPEPRAIIFPWAPEQPNKLPGRMLRSRKYARATPEHAKSLESAVEKNPDDEALRHEWADALEETGEKDRADVIRNGPRSIEIHGRRWRDRTYGNTYHASDIIADGNRVAITPTEYGYGDHFLWTAMDHMEKHGIAKGRERTPTRYGDKVEGPRAWARRHGIKFDYTVEDVPRKRDLVRNQRKYAASDDDLSMDFDSMGEDQVPRAPMQRPAPKEDITGRTRKQILQQILDAAKKGHFDPSGMTPTDYIRDMESGGDVPQDGGQVYLSDPEDEELDKHSRQITYPTS